jgi:DNA-binding MarR family transcriptional regulator
VRIETFLRESPLMATIQAGRQFETRVAGLLSAQKVNFSGALILAAILLEDPGKVKPSDLAVVLSTTRGNISHSIAALEAGGLLTRRLDPDDARAHHLALKPEGKKIAMQVVRVLHRMETSLEKRVGTAQIKNFTRVLKELGEAGGRGV